MSANDGLKCLLIYETRDGFHAYRCDSRAFDNLSNTLRSERLFTPIGSVFYKYPSWLPPEDAKQIAIGWAKTQVNSTNDSQWLTQPCPTGGVHHENV